MVRTVYAQGNQMNTAARMNSAAHGSAAVSSCRQAVSAANADLMTLILDAAIAASIFVICLLGRIIRTDLSPRSWLS